ncbi:CD225/dispanin family protein [Sphingobacterium spiritivorum]|uniref:Interferon-induced transmembrane protein n=1 Tax=Sphingobacterium spiritivorum ATCC 33861 TaxID=525373 RepID=D7VHW4_SPHSI|nr:CD225/dispanin family protein [Sphingobacterium spiritivorum]EFK59666.1 Interferon-induced transmembrane protein [Sphingobacterium spiritivorum ATCC 33861]QQT37680.1 CD225/dispanin family protein [Sphingobacterium spiritivorum]WQD34482.1 CD225/dispanin family protein [Sphingobacterium spiritivorum]SUI97461.1 Interferon-induced transmembrane protein [Sphingobacterium spiritivorum]
MQKYHYTDGVNSFGPFSLEELKTKNITADTYVWTPELTDWKKAGELPELAELLKQESQSLSAPPQLPSAPAQPTFQHNAGSGAQFTPTSSLFEQPPKTYLIESILVTVLCCWPLGIPAIVYAAKVENKFYRGDKAGAQADSASAKKWIMISLIGCVVFWILYIAIFGGLAYFGSTLDTNSDYSY